MDPGAVLQTVHAREHDPVAGLYSLVYQVPSRGFPDDMQRLARHLIAVSNGEHEYFVLQLVSRRLRDRHDRGGRLRDAYLTGAARSQQTLVIREYGAEADRTHGLVELAFHQLDLSLCPINGIVSQLQLYRGHGLDLFLDGLAGGPLRPLQEIVFAHGEVGIHLFDIRQHRQGLRFSFADQRTGLEGDTPDITVDGGFQQGIAEIDLRIVAGRFCLRDLRFGLLIGGLRRAQLHI